MNYEELVKSRINIGDMTKEELFTYCGGLLSEVWGYEKENIDLQNRYDNGTESISYRQVFMEIREAMQALEIAQELEQGSDKE